MIPDVIHAAAALANPGYGGCQYPLNLSNPTYIVAPGPNGYDFAQKLDPRESVIAVNKACELKPWRYWLVIDANAYRCDWYHAPFPSTIPIMGTKIQDKRARYTMRPEDCPDDCSVTGAALAICFAAGLRAVVLVGADMQKGYYDGNPSSWEAEWPHRPYLDELIKSYRRRNMLVYSAGPTALDVPLWGG